MEKKKILEKDLAEEMKSAYLDYAMSVIVSRAIPDVRDGLKPVQRRILYSMHEMGLRPEGKFKKCAAVVGNVMGKYHPHGDAPIYEALVRMGQDFNLRYPLIKGQGNFGSIDGDPPAAQRYTECKLSEIGREMLKDIEKETVDFSPNYDGTSLEPNVLPSPLPQILLNGSIGIAVGMATSIPPHNLSEICDALIYLLENPKAKTEDLFKFLKGPDFPTGGLIFDKESIIKAYCQGRGPIVCRAKTQILEEKGKKKILISEIPYQVSKAELLEELARLVQERKIEEIKNIRDESDREGLRISIELEKKANEKMVLNSLFKYSQLQKVFHLNLVCLLDGIQPKVLNLIEILNEFLNHRKEVVIKRTKFDLKKARERVQILEGLKICLEKIDKVIKIIKTSEDKKRAKENLIKAFNLDSIQAESILEMKLSLLSKLEREKIEKELKEKKGEIKKFEKILKSDALIKEEIKKELKELKKKYGDERKTKLIDEKIEEIKEEELIPEEDFLIILTKNGIIKKIDPKEYKIQKRGKKGILAIKNDGDFVKNFVLANNRESLLLFSESGKAFLIPVYKIPKEKKGETIFSLFKISQKEKILTLTPIKKGEKGKFLLFLTSNGKIKKSQISNFEKIRKTGTIAIKLKKGEILKDVKNSKKEDLVLIYTKKGMGILFKEKEIREMGRLAEGVRGIKLKKEDDVEGMEILQGKKFSILTISENGFGKRVGVENLRIQKRGGKGIKIAKIDKKTGNLKKVLFSKGGEELILITEKGKALKTLVTLIPKMKREAKGVKLIKIEEDRLASAILI